MAKRKGKRRFRGILIILGLIMALGYGSLIWYYPLNYTEIIMEETEQYNLDPYLVLGIIHTESKFRTTAVSTKNARGLMQITESTWTWALTKMGQTDGALQWDNPRDNLEVGIWYLNYLVTTFPNYEEPLLLAAYNAGEGNIRKWLADPSVSDTGQVLNRIPFAETAQYVKRVLWAEKVYKLLYPKAFSH